MEGGGPQQLQELQLQGSNLGFGHLEVDRLHLGHPGGSMSLLLPPKNNDDY